MAAKITACFTFLKEALILPTLNLKLFAPVLLFFAVTAFLDSLVHVVFVQPLGDGMASHLAEINSTDPLERRVRQAHREVHGDGGDEAGS